MGEVFLKKIIDREFETLTVDELKVRQLYVEMMGLIGAGNNPQVLMTVAVAIEEACK